MSKGAGKKAIVIGAGAGGLAVAIRLRVMGFAVQVFEASAGPGGKLGLLEQDGYRFDTGPSLFTMPEQVSDLFALAGVEMFAYFKYQKLDELTRYFWEDGSQFIAQANLEAFCKAASEATGEDAGRILRHLQLASKQYDLVGELFLRRSMRDPMTYLNPQALKAYLFLPLLGLFNSMAAGNSKALQTEKMRQYFNRFATYNGSNPWQTPALLSMIAHLEHGKGAYLPEGGMYAIPLALEKLAKDLGVEFHYNQPVQEILIANNKAVGIRLPNQQVKADVVISNADMVLTYNKLLPKQPQPKKLLSQQKSSSALIFYWGIAHEFKQLGLHNIFWSEDYKTEFKQIFEKQTVNDDPTVYINITSKHISSDAPAGCENWFVMVNVPHNNGQDWEALRAKTKAAVIAKLSRMLGTDIAPLIATEAYLDPLLIQSKTGSAQGALYGNSSNNRFAAFLRHQNRSPFHEGLYFCGGSVHPGGGVPLALLSGMIAADEVGKDLRR